jgi:hypothetical protein
MTRIKSISAVHDDGKSLGLPFKGILLDYENPFFEPTTVNHETRKMDGYWFSRESGDDQGSEVLTDFDIGI